MENVGFLEKKFKLAENGSNVKTEVTAGITTFVTMAYILAVNPMILSAAGMDRSAVFTATAISAALATLIMSIFANLPFALAPGMGLNAYLAFYVCGFLGISWQVALTAVFLEGIIFIFLTIFNVREAIINCIPEPVKNAISVGIGLFIALIGLVAAGIVKTGMSVVAYTDAGEPILDGTVVTLGNIVSKPTIIAIFGIILTSVLVIKNVKGGMLLGMVSTTVISVVFGVVSLDGFHLFQMPPSISPIALKFDFHNIFTIEMFVVLFTLLFVDMFDTIGTLIGVCNKAGMLTKDGKVPKAKAALFADAIGTTVGAMIGTSTVTTYVESASGVSEGGRTGLTSLVTGILFALSLFFSGVFLLIPGIATASALVIVGMFMMEPITKIDWKNYSHAIPAFLTLALMPFTYSIAEGISFGVISFVAIALLSGNRKELKVSTVILSVFFVLKYIIPEITKYL